MDAEEFIKLKSYNDNLFPKPTEAQEGLNILIKHFLGEDWYIVDPLPTTQYNTISIYYILSKYKNKKSIWEKLKGYLNNFNFGS